MCGAPRLPTVLPLPLTLTPTLTLTLALTPTLSLTLTLTPTLTLTLTRWEAAERLAAAAEKEVARRAEAEVGDLGGDLGEV